MNKFKYFEITNTSILKASNKLEAEQIAIARRTEIKTHAPNMERIFVVEIKISDKNLSYKSDFTEAETVFWLEAMKNIILSKSFEDTK